MEYNLSQYYQTPVWAAKRSERLRIDGYRCAKCGFTRALEVHHINYERLGHEDVSRDLITLCKKCHGEIEAQKREVNPIKKTERHSAYLAGKITKNGWRNNFNYPYSISAEEIARDYTLHVNDSLAITGPFFISCDHGCYHGDGKHGVGAVDSLHPDERGCHSEEWGGCMGNFYTKDEVLVICKRQIDRAEIVFAYIDERDCYGTLAEIGYAHAKGKDLVIVFSNECLKKEMWFADKMQQRSGNVSNRWINEQLFSRIRED